MTLVYSNKKNLPQIFWSIDYNNNNIYWIDFNVLYIMFNSLFVV